MFRSISYKLIYIFLAAAVAIVYFSGSNIKNILKLKEEVVSYEKNLQMLERENERLTQELKWIESEEDYIKYLARKKLGLVEPGEIKFFLIDSDNTKK